MVVNFNDGTTLEIADEKVWEVYRAINIGDYEDRIKDSYNIRHNGTDEPLTDDELHQLAVRVNYRMMDDCYLSEEEENSFQNALADAVRADDYYEGEVEY